MRFRIAMDKPVGFCCVATLKSCGAAGVQCGRRDRNFCQSGGLSV